MTGTLAERARLIAAGAVAAERETGYPAEIIGGQAALESGWLASAKGNNPFGWKAKGEEPRQLLDTTEVFTPAQANAFRALGDGREIFAMADVERSGRRLPRAPKGKAWYRVRDWFAVFPSLADAFVQHGLRLQAGRYNNAWLNYRDGTSNRHTRVQELARNIANAGYATAPDYAESLIAVALGARLTNAISTERKKL